jgi:hypothetical protein
MIIVISSSDLPEPVPPAIIPCTPSVLADMCSVRGRLPEAMPSVTVSQSASSAEPVTAHF